MPIPKEFDLLDIDENIVDPKSLTDKIRRSFVLKNILPVHQKLTDLINSNPDLDSKERDRQLSVLVKFAESVGTLGSDEKQSASITKIYQKNTLIMQNPLIQQIVQAHCKELAPGLYKEIEDKKED